MRSSEDFHGWIEFFTRARGLETNELRANLEQLDTVVTLQTKAGRPIGEPKQRGTLGARRVLIDRPHKAGAHWRHGEQHHDWGSDDYPR